MLAVARTVFRAHGHTATTRQIADAAGISEAVLYRRFGSKDDLFFAAMRPSGPDLEQLLGPAEPPPDARLYLGAVAERICAYFAEVLPQALHVMTHPAFDPQALARAQPRAASILRAGLALRLRCFARRRVIERSAVPTAARLLVSLAHDVALGGVLAQTNTKQRARVLRQMVDLIWNGLATERTRSAGP